MVASNKVGVVLTTPSDEIDVTLADRIKMQLYLCTDVNAAYVHKEFTDRDYGPEMVYRLHAKHALPVIR